MSVSDANIVLFWKMQKCFLIFFIILLPNDMNIFHHTKLVLYRNKVYLRRNIFK